MQPFFSVAVYALVCVGVVVSFVKSKEKTLLALKKAWKMFLTVLPQFVAILLAMGMILAVVEQDTLKKLIGADSGFLGIAVSATVGAVTLVPVIIAFPIASELLTHGAGLVPVAVFISTLTTVGVITIPLETKYFGKKITLLRNALFFLAAFLVAWIVGLVLT